MKTGLLFGKFAPLTRGHEKMILDVMEQVDHLFLILSFDQKFVDTQAEWIKPKLSYQARMLDLMRCFNHYRKITVLSVDESNIAGYPEGSKDYELLVRAALPADVKLTHAFSSEPEYESYFNEHFPECEHVVIDAGRVGVPCSATMIRENLQENFHYLTNEARARFIRRVAIVGVESTGKSTLTINLASHFMAEYTPEIGRHICEVDFCSREDLMSRNDYLNIALQHRLEEQQDDKWSPSCVKFSDTTNLITHFSAVCANKAGVIDPTFQALSKEEGDNFYDLVLYLQPDVPWVADPLRLQDTPEKREETNFILDMMIRKAYSRTHVVKIDGSDFNERTKKAIDAVEMLLNNELPEIE